MIGTKESTQLTYLEYQLLLLSLVGAMCIAIFLMEFALSRFQVLPLLFPGMFHVRERRFYFFNFDISDGNLGKTIRADAKMLIRMALCLTLSYLWQHCVLESRQQVGTSFPTERCAEKADCFASKFHYNTFFERQYQAVDCSDPEQKDFPSQVVVSCVRFVKPSAEIWLMQLAIAHSLMQFICKSYVVSVWVVGSSKVLRRATIFGVVATLSVLLGLFFGEVVSTFISSWLSFVMSLSVPLFLGIVWKDGNALSRLLVQEARQNQVAIEERLNTAFDDLGSMTPCLNLLDDEPAVPRFSGEGRIGNKRFRKMSGNDMKKFLHAIPKRLRSKTGFFSSAEAASSLRDKDIPEDDLERHVSPEEVPSTSNPVAADAAHVDLGMSYRRLSPAIVGASDVGASGEFTKASSNGRRIRKPPPRLDRLDL
jgi:hypothetical protein